MTYQVHSAGFQERLRRIEQAQSAKDDIGKRGRGSVSVSLLFNMALVTPVWFMLTKSLIMAHLGQSAYGSRLAELGNSGALPEVVATLFRPDPVSLAMTQVLSQLLGA